jgi:hypothetical protein
MSHYQIMRFFRSTPIRTFVLYPLLTLLWEFAISKGKLNFQRCFYRLVLWGHLQYRLCGKLANRLGPAYIAYTKSVKRWPSGHF